MLNCLDLQKSAIIQPPATQKEVDQIQSEFALSFPIMYVQLLLCSNGLVIHHEFSSLNLYATHELAERNQTYQVNRFAPRLLLIGDNGGGEGIFITIGYDDSPVYLIGLGTMQIEDGTILSTTVQGWVEKHFPLPQKNNRAYPNIVDVYLTSLPSGGVHELLRIKHILNLHMSIMELRKGVEHLPFRLLRAVPFWKYVKLVLLYNSQNTCLALFPVDKTDRSIPLPSLILDDNKNSA